jgi:hypothetical protein
MAEEVKKKKTLSEVASAASALMEQMGEESNVDPFAIAAKRPGEETLTEVPQGQAEPTPIPKEPIEPQPVAFDPWADVEDVEYEDADTGEHFVVRAPKSYASKVKDGYARRSVMDRNSRYLAQAKPILEPLITSGQFSSIQPLLDRALHDPEFAETVGDLYQRRLRGEPLTQTQEKQLNQGLVAVQQEAEASPELEEAYNDPYVRAIGSLVDKAIMAKLSPFQEELSRTRQYEEQRQRQEQQERLADQEARRVKTEILSEMKSLYPAEFGGSDSDASVRIGRLFNYAVQSGYIQDYNPNTVKLGIRLAYRELGATASPSTAAAVMTAEQVERDARARAAQLVGGRTGGGSTLQQAPPLSQAQVLSNIKSRRKDGTMKKPQEIAAEVSRALDRVSGS